MLHAHTVKLINQLNMRLFCIYVKKIHALTFQVVYEHRIIIWEIVIFVSKMEILAHPPLVWPLSFCLFIRAFPL